MAITFNPSVTTSPGNTFFASTQGWTQGIPEADPSSRMWLRSAIVAADVTGNIWGGMLVEEQLSLDGEASPGTQIIIATASTMKFAYSVYEREYNAVISPASTAPMVSAGQSVAYYRAGTNARIPFPASSALIATLSGAQVGTGLTWNFTTNQFDTTGTSVPGVIVGYSTNSRITSFDSTTGALSWTIGNAILVEV